jgi:S1-C subfamily serine protease
MSPRWAAAALAIALALAAGCGGDDGSSPAVGGSDEPATDGRAATGDEPERAATTRVEVVEAAPEGAGFNPRAIYERTAQGVVTVQAVFQAGGLSRLLDGDEDRGAGVGSGFVLNERGEIATNAHVITQGEQGAIRRANDVYVEFADRNRVEARIVGYDANTDIALLRVSPKGLTLRTLPLGRSAKVQVGEPVAAIGSPFGERQSLTVGVVSAIDRSIRGLTQFHVAGAIQTDAAINPGNSGGPLVNARGEVVGVNQQIRTSTGANEGVGYALPIDAVKHSLDKLREDGTAEYAYLGVSTVALYPQLVERFDLPVERGAWVQEVTADGPADDAGVQGGDSPVAFQSLSFRPGGDIITRIGRSPVTDPDHLSSAISAYEPGDTVEIEFWRDGKRRTIQVKAEERPLGRAAQQP